MHKAVIIPPEPSTTSFVVQLWGYQDAAVQNTSAKPHNLVFFIDRQDYDRIRRLATDSKKYLSIFISLKNLVDCGKITLHDYSNLYDITHKSNYTREINKTVEDLDGDRVDDLSSRLHGGWMNTARSNRMLDIREAIGEDRSELEASKIGDRKKLNKMENGTATIADTYHYLKKLLKRLAVAFVVANQINKHQEYPHTEVVGVAARPGGIEHLKQSVIVPDDVFTRDSKFMESLFSPSEKYQKYESAVSSTLNELSREIVDQGTDREEIVPGLEFLHNFDLEHISEEVNTVDEDELKTHAMRAKNEIEVEVPSSPEVGYVAEKAREGILNKLPQPEIVPSLASKQTGIPLRALATDIQTYSASLKMANRVQELSQSGNFRQTGLLVAATTLSNPIYRYERHSRFYDWFNTIMNRFSIDSPSESDEQWYETQRKMTDDYIFTGRWYE